MYCLQIKIVAKKGISMKHHDHTETEIYEPIYQCSDCGAQQEWHKLVVIRLDTKTVVRCFVCGSERVKRVEG